MPNFKGGKHYKKKKSNDQTNAILQIDRLPDQQVARVVRVLGNRNMLCYCNDNLMRVCRVRGKLRNRVYIELGDVVLISLRDFDLEEEAPSTNAPLAKDGIPLMPSELAPPPKKEEKEPSMRGDILAKYPAEYHSKLKKEDGVNPRLFLQLEVMGDKSLETIGGKRVEDTGFEFDRESATESGSESSADDHLDVDAI